MMTSMKSHLKKSVKWYDANLEVLLTKCRGKYVGVCINQVGGVWDDFDSGFEGMVTAGFKPGDFIVHRCVPLKDEPRLRFRKPIFFGAADGEASLHFIVIVSANHDILARLAILAHGTDLVERLDPVAPPEGAITMIRDSESAYRK